MVSRNVTTIFIVLLNFACRSLDAKNTSHVADLGSERADLRSKFEEAGVIRDDLSLPNGPYFVEGNWQCNSSNRANPAEISIARLEPNIYSLSAPGRPTSYLFRSGGELVQMIVQGDSLTAEAIRFYYAHRFDDNRVEALIRAGKVTGASLFRKLDSDQGEQLMIQIGVPPSPSDTMWNYTNPTLPYEEATERTLWGLGAPYVSSYMVCARLNPEKSPLPSAMG